MLVFAHANGFPAPSYRVLLELLGRHYEVCAPDMLGHAPRFPVSDNWPCLLDELSDFVQRRRGGQRVVLVGHSMGGLLGLMLAAAHPDWLRALVLLDSPLIGGWRAALLWASKRSGLIWRVAPTSLALRRRRAWPDLQSVREHLGAKPPFAAWDPRMLEDYASAGTVERGAMRALRFEPEIEASIYATLPHHLGRLGLRRAGVPIGFVGGTESRELAMAGMRATRRLVGPHLRWIIGASHLFPFEQPRATASTVLELLHELGAGPHSGRPVGSVPAQVPIMPISRSDTAS